jgi:UDP-N-acetylglucosamine 1-carboxyvinyltransferase
LASSSNEEFDKMVIEGSAKLSGSVIVSGAKNAALPILAASILSSESVMIENLPIVDDVLTLKAAMETFGVSVQVFDHSACINASNIINHIMYAKYSKKIRASVLVAGSLLGRFGEAIIAEPGGCVIGNRPIDLHLMGFRALGAKIEQQNKGYLRISAGRLKGTKINLPFPSIGATENIMIAACLAEGQTIINNSALEPEIVDLANFLRKMGARIKGDGSSIIKIDGVKKLNSVDYKIIPDRIEAGSFMIAAAMTGGQVTVNNVIPEHLARLIDILNKVGATVTIDGDYNSITVKGKNSFNPLNVVTACFPGFPTDLQPLLTSMLSLSKGVSTITDTVFPKRFCYVTELRRMGADITVINNSAVVRGIERLHGAEVFATDLRGGFALVLAGLVAKDTTTIKNVHFIDRGYENLPQKLQQLGASIIRELSSSSSKSIIPICVEEKIKRKIER